MSDKPHLQFHQTPHELSDKPHLIFFQTLSELPDKVHLPFFQAPHELPDKPHLQFHQTLPELPDKVHLPFLQTLSELPDKVHLSFFQTPHELPDKVHLPFFQTLPESRNVQNSFAFYPPPPLRIQPKKQSAFRRRKWKKNPYPITMKLFYEQECRLQILPQQYYLLSFLILRCSAPPFSFLRMSRPFTLLHSHPSAVP